MPKKKNLIMSVSPFILFLLFCCSSNNLTDNQFQTDTSAMLIMAQSDFSVGMFQCMSIYSRSVEGASFPIFDDAKVFSYGGFIYILELYGADNIIKLDPSESDSGSIVYIKHLGNNWNPQDIKFVDNTKAYIANMDAPKITVFNPSTGEITGNIDISSFAYLKLFNESPFASDMQLVGSDLYVLLQRRNEYGGDTTSQILKIDTKTDKVTDSIGLRNNNGIAMVYYDNALYVTNPGDLFTDGDGAIEKVNLADRTVTTVIDETSLGGNPYKIIHEKGSLFYVTVFAGWRNVPVVEIDAEKGIVVNTVPNVKDAFGGILYDDMDGTLYVGERDTLNTGVRIFRNNKQTGDVIRLPNSLPVTNMCIYRQLFE